MAAATRFLSSETATTARAVGKTLPPFSCSGASRYATRVSGSDCKPKWGERPDHPKALGRLSAWRALPAGQAPARRDRGRPACNRPTQAAQSGSRTIGMQDYEEGPEVNVFSFRCPAGCGVPLEAARSATSLTLSFRPSGLDPTSRGALDLLVRVAERPEKPVVLAQEAGVSEEGIDVLPDNLSLRCHLE